MRYLLRAILAGVLGFAVSLLIAACGGGKGLLSSGQSSTLSNQLGAVSTAVASGNCSNAATAATGLNNLVGSLPASVNATLRNNLIQGASTVAELAQHDCHQTTSAPAATSTPAVTASTSATAPTTTSTQSSTSTTSTPPPTSTTSSTSATTPSTSGTTPTGGTGGAGLGGAGGAAAGGTGSNTPGGNGK